MGGLVFDFDESFPSNTQPFAAGIDRLSLTPRGVKLLAQCGHLPALSEKDIVDKSKTDEIGKFLACLQAIWMLVQVCTRLGLDLPVTLLEVSAVSHVLCALILYSLWWHKPRKVGVPTVLRGEWTAPLAAFMMIASQIGQDQMLPGFRMAEDRSEVDTLRFFVEMSAGEEETVADKDKETAILRAAVPETPRFRIRSKSGLPLIEQGDTDHQLVRDDEDIKSRLTRRRWLLACTAVQRYPAIRRMLRRPITEATRKLQTALAAYPEMPEKMQQAAHEETTLDGPPTWWECSSQHLVASFATNWPHDGLLRTTGGLVVGATLWIASIAFTAVYIAAWDADFPSPMENWLWRSSAVYVAFSGLLWAVLHVAAEYSARLWWAWYNIMSGEASKSLTVAMWIVCGLCGCMYLFARAFLIIEAFICLRSLSVASYVVPSWTMGVPHVG